MLGDGCLADITFGFESLHSQKRGTSYGDLEEKVEGSQGSYEGDKKMVSVLVGERGEGGGGNEGSKPLPSALA
jgi:hypothetical protein